MQQMRIAARKDYAVSETFNAKGNMTAMRNRVWLRYKKTHLYFLQVLTPDGCWFTIDGF